MTRQILVPIDGSSQAREAFEHALREFPDATFVALTVVDPVETGVGGTERGMTPYPDDWMEIQKERAEERFEEVEAFADERGITLETAIDFGRPSRVIVEYAEEHAIDQIVMGSHGRDGLSRILLGSVAESVIRLSPCPVTVVR